MIRRVYLAGPDVFHKDAAGLGARKTALCRAYGFEGLYPLDADLTEPTSAAIYAACRAMMDAADFGIFNLTPFRGPSADAGTVFELGLMAGQGKPVFAYSNAAGDFLERLKAWPGVTQQPDGWRDPLDMMAEDFGNADNLMLDETLHAHGRKIHRRKVAEALRFDDLEGFELCLAEAHAFFGT